MLLRQRTQKMRRYSVWYCDMLDIRICFLWLVQITKQFAGSAFGIYIYRLGALYDTKLSQTICADNDHLQMHSWSGAVLLPGWRLYPVSWQLRSADSGTLVVSRTRTTIGRRDFAVSGPVTWNSLPSNCGLQLCLSRHLYKDSKVISLAASASQDSL